MKMPFELMMLAVFAAFFAVTAPTVSAMGPYTYAAATRYSTYPYRSGYINPSPSGYSKPPSYNPYSSTYPNMDQSYSTPYHPYTDKQYTSDYSYEETYPDTDYSDKCDYVDTCEKCERVTSLSGDEDPAAQPYSGLASDFSDIFAQYVSPAIYAKKGPYEVECDPTGTGAPPESYTCFELGCDCGCSTCNPSSVLGLTWLENVNDNTGSGDIEAEDDVGIGNRRLLQKKSGIYACRLADRDPDEPEEFVYKIWIRGRADNAYANSNCGAGPPITPSVTAVDVDGTPAYPPFSNALEPLQNILNCDAYIRFYAQLKCYVNANDILQDPCQFPPFNEADQTCPLDG